MSDINSERMRREAADAVGSRPPAASGARIEAAMRRYLGTSMFETLRRGTRRADPAAERHPAEPSSEDHR